MTKWVHNDVFGKGLEEIKNNATRLVVLSQVSATPAYSDLTSYKLAEYTINSDAMTIEDGDVSGRKITIAAQSGGTVDANGTATHVALADASRVLLVTEVEPDQVLTAGNPIETPAFNYEMRDPA